MRLTMFVPASILLGSMAAIANAAPRLVTPDSAQVGDIVVEEPTSEYIQFARKIIPASLPTSSVLAQSKTIYLNHTGVTLHPGNDDSRTNASSIVNGQVTVPAWNTSAANWAATMTCFKAMFSRFDVTITDVNPGNVPHIEAVFGGTPQQVGMPAGVGGVSPFTSDCGIIENSVVFTFTSVLPQNPQTMCEVMAQEVAHSYGLDHELLASDPMTYLNYNGARTFKDQLVSCGESSARNCGIGGSTCRAKQNSVALLTERLGTVDAIAPTMGITSPQNGDSVIAGFEVTATATDNNVVTMATLSIDGVVAATTPGAGPYTFPTDAALARGPHTVKVEASDGHNVQSQTINVMIVEDDGTGSGGGSGSGSGGGGGGGGGDDDGGDGTGTNGGCSTGGSSGLAVGLLMLAVGFRRRRG
ncbi:hypothetical protein BH11MYX3_BH11MYX3_20300 [soil metagenome]